jgi:putative glutamine amidotransferase
MTPRIAIPIPTTRDLPYNQRSQPVYARAIALSGGEPVEIPLATTGAALRELLGSCHGVCLPGSPADVDPALYGAERDPATAPADEPREAMDRALLEDAQATGKPVLAICFGTQFLNVWLGGTLVQDLTPLPVNHEAGSKVAIAHTALVAPASLLASLIEPGELAADQPSSTGGEFGNFLRLPINTSHHQAVGAPGQGLRIVARCPDDGVIEAIELDPATDPLFHVEQARGSRFVLGVQWHPERSFDISATSRALFSRLVVEARALADREEAA